MTSASSEPNRNGQTSRNQSAESDHDAEHETKQSIDKGQARLELDTDSDNAEPGPDSAASSELLPDEAPSPEAMLTPIEARVLGCLMEKQRTTPDQYPLTLNALVTACNQKSARDPVMKLQPGEVGHCVGQLRDRGLVHASFTGRSERFDHKLTGHFMLDRQQQALLCVLMLRGPQTPGELRTHCVRLADFDSLAAVQTSLDQLAEHNPPLVRELQRHPGMREQRYSHLLCGEPRLPPQRASATIPRSASSTATDPAISTADWEALVARVEQLEAELSAVRTELKTVKSKLP